MRDSSSNKPKTGVLLRVLTSHYQSLVSARSEECLLEQYATLLEFLRSDKCDFLGGTGHKGHATDPVQGALRISDEELRKAPLSDIKKLVDNATITRRELERVAIERFSVPHGSMRRFSNRQMLMDKLRTLIDNERTHETISEIARGQPRNPHPDSSKKDPDM